jgi:hypothetical protein
LWIQTLIGLFGPTDLAFSAKDGLKSTLSRYFRRRFARTLGPLKIFPNHLGQKPQREQLTRGRSSGHPKTHLGFCSPHCHYRRSPPPPVGLGPCRCRGARPLAGEDGGGGRSFRDGEATATTRGRVELCGWWIYVDPIGLYVCWCDFRPLVEKGPIIPVGKGL